LDRYASERVLNHELVREPGLIAAPARTAFWIPVASVTSPFDWKTATSGACWPVPKVFSARWFDSYAE
jgi:hypothetical protein